MRLAAIRREIDAVDQDLLALFNRRAALSLEVGHIKADVPGIIFKPIREKEVLDGLAAGNSGPLPNDHLRAIWREIFSSSRSLQRPQNVAYLGPEGTFSYFAGVEYLGHAARFRPCTDITQVFQEVASGQCELGVVPLENSLQGTVGVSFDLFLKYEVHIQAELFSRISHCLLSNAPSMNFITSVAYFALLAGQEDLLPFLTPSFRRRQNAARKMLTEDARMFAGLFEANPHSHEAVRQYRNMG
jgi:Prephenate dehydratase